MIGWLMNMEQLAEWGLAGNTEVLGGNPPKYHIVHHESHTKWPDVEHGPPWGEAGN
jgi:hypothetical protein